MNYSTAQEEKDRGIGYGFSPNPAANDSVEKMMKKLADAPDKLSGGQYSHRDTLRTLGMNAHGILHCIAGEMEFSQYSQDNELCIDGWWYTRPRSIANFLEHYGTGEYPSFDGMKPSVLISYFSHLKRLKILHQRLIPEARHLAWSKNGYSALSYTIDFERVAKTVEYQRGEPIAWPFSVIKEKGYRAW